MIMKANKQIGFIYKNEESIDKILKDGNVVFERGFLRERTSTTLPITFGGVGKDLKDYKIYGNTKQQLLPNGYTQVDYIESDTNSYIDMGLKGNQNTKITTSISFESGGTFLGDITNSSKAISLRFFRNNSGSISRFGNKSVEGVFTNYNYNTKYLIEINSDGILVDNELIHEWGDVGTFETTTNLYLFKNSTSSTAPRAYIYYCKVYDGNTLVRDFVPCYRNSDNEVGLYDLVNNVFYTNQGTGVFTYGSIAPTPDAPIEMVSCGDLITDTSDVNYGKYKIPVNVNNVITNIYLDEPLRKIDGYSDYIDFVNGKAVRNISEVVLNGSETWSMNSVQGNIKTQRFRAIGEKTHVVNMGYSNNFRVKDDSISVYEDTELLQVSSSQSNKYIGVQINIDRLASNTVADFVAWLSSNPVTLDYVLLTPTEESITLPNIPTIDGNNTLNIETEITPSQVYIKYKSNT